MLTANAVANDHVGPMPDPPHLGELIRAIMDDMGWNVTRTVACPGCERDNATVQVRTVPLTG